MSRSLRVHPDHKSAISAALERNGFLTQGDLAANLFVALSTVNNFCRGIKVSVAKFEQICEALGLEPRELILPKDAQTTSQSVQPAPHSPQSHFFAYDPFWVGRADLIRDLTTQLNNTCRLMLVTGIAGVGKTALAERLSVELTENSAHFKRHTLRENFDNEEQPTDFASVAARLLAKCGQPVSPEDRSHPQRLARQLIAHLQTTPTLILIDSLEKILQGNPATGHSEFIDEGFVSFFKAILATDTLQSQFILTSQEFPAQISEVGSRYLNFWHQQPIRGLSDAEQQTLFKKTGFTLTDTLTRIGKAYEGHPLALRTILGEIGSHPFYGNVRAYWKRYGQEIEAVEKVIEEAAAGKTVGADDKWQLDRFTRALRRNVQQRLEYTFERLQQDARYAYILLCESAVYRCPVPEDWWLSHLEDWTSATLSPRESEAVQIAALDVLRDRYLVEEMTEDTELLLKQHNLIRSTSLAHLENLKFTP